jgi:hypothetical protein
MRSKEHEKTTIRKTILIKKMCEKIFCASFSDADISLSKREYKPKSAKRENIYKYARIILYSPKPSFPKDLVRIPKDTTPKKALPSFATKEMAVFLNSFSVTDSIPLCDAALFLPVEHL